MTKVISFMSQKGGTGKTTLSILTATFLHSIGAGVAVIDADFPQHSFTRTRTKDILDLKEKQGKKQGENLTLVDSQIKPYPVVDATVKEATVALKSMKTSQQLDFILIDIPGTFNVEGIDYLIDSLDLIIVPVELEYKSITAAMETMSMIRSLNPKVSISVVWTKIKRNHKVAERQAYEDYFKSKFNPYIFKYMLLETVRVSQLLNTITPQPESISEFVDEAGTMLLSIEGKTALMN
ncbi:ParA family protein [Spirosoma sp.]|uniref:ParA family protein n=1 Tax=Spirosoma sp. TaxID=1899569 RepID=UPI00260D08BB|nr:AAA family ATPase [Spirosoma sp.]MCX6213771.1 AAA family ATPase [Spirosoma sp.]